MEGRISLKSQMLKEKIRKGAKKIIDICAGVKSGEKILIITDPDTPLSIAKALKNAAMELKADPTIIITNFEGPLGQEPNSIVASAMLHADVILSPTCRTIAHSHALKSALNKGARAIVMTECNESILEGGAIDADFLSLQPAIEYVKMAFNRASNVQVTTKLGTDLYLDITKRNARTCSGLCHQPGKMIGIPDLEVYIAPLEDKTEGTIVIDASCSIIGLIDNPVTLKICNGRVISISGDREATKIENILTQTKDSAAWVIAEFAIGLNPAGSVIGNIIVDEGIYGTGHLAVGNNIHFGGMNRSLIHLDMVYHRPTIRLDRDLFMSEGELVYFKDDLTQLKK